MQTLLIDVPNVVNTFGAVLDCTSLSPLRTYTFEQATGSCVQLFGGGANNTATMVPLRKDDGTLAAFLSDAMAVINAGPKYVAAYRIAGTTAVTGYVMAEPSQTSAVITGDDVTITATDDVTVTAGDDITVGAGDTLTMTAVDAIVTTTGDVTVTAGDDLRLNGTDAVLIDAGATGMQLTSDASIILGAAAGSTVRIEARAPAEAAQLSLRESTGGGSNEYRMQAAVTMSANVTVVKPADAPTDDRQVEIIDPATGQQSWGNAIDAGFVNLTNGASPATNLRITMAASTVIVVQTGLRVPGAGNLTRSYDVLPADRVNGAPGVGSFIVTATLDDGTINALDQSQGLMWIAVNTDP